MPLENSSESYTREQAMKAFYIEMGIPPEKFRHCWGINDTKPIIVIPTVKLLHGKEDPNAVIKDLESQQIPVIKESKTKSISAATDLITNFMSNGTKEFEKRTGRPMTYGEMRAAWG
jgi:hypothetical protein